MKERPAITILIHRDGHVGSRSYRIPLWLVRTGLTLAGLLTLAVILGAVLYVPILGVVAQVHGLKSENATLRSENIQVRRLVETVDSLESQYAKVRGMLGADVTDENGDSSSILRAPAIVVEVQTIHSDSTAAIPVRWPLYQTGYITRGQLGAGDDATHAGLDIAVPVGTPVRASGSGSVAEAAQDREYGLYVLIKHEEGYETRYAHLSRIIATVGKDVRAGEVIGLSGNSGRSSAPHLHFEIRRKGQSIDPLTLIKEGR
ncbi:MAG: M23 family metallopeptidase [Gemmatimonadota bacterium]